MRARVAAERRVEHRGRGQERRAAARLGVHVGHEQRAVLPRQPVEGDAPPLGQQLPDLDVVLLVGALLVGAHRVAVEQARLARPLAECGGDAGLVGELSAVVDEHDGEHPAHVVVPEQGAQGAQRAHGLGRRLRRQGQRQLDPRRPVQQRQHGGGVAGAPLAVSISQQSSRASSGSARNAACDLRSEWGVGLRGTFLLLGL